MVIIMANVSSSNGIEKRPKLRFRSNTNVPFPEWESHTLAEYLLSRVEKQVPTDEAPLMAFTAEGGVEPKGDRYDRSYLVKSDSKLYKRTEFGDFIYSSNNLDVGSMGLNKYGTAVISDVYEIFSVKDTAAPSFIDELIHRPNVLHKILQFRQGCLYGQYRIYADDFLSVSVHAPSKVEQQCISDFFATLDEKIMLQKKLIEHLKKYKRGVVKTLLDSKLNKRQGVIWKTETIGNLGTFIKGAALSKADISDTGVPFILYGELYTTYKEVVRDIIRTTQASVDDVYLSRVGDVVVPTSGETPEEISTASCIMVPDVILAGDLNIYRSTIVDGRIMSYLLNHIVNDLIARVAQGKSVVHVQASEIGKISITYPDHQEQERIAQILELLDNRITASENTLNSMQEMKKALLQQLFI